MDYKHLKYFIALLAAFGFTSVSFTQNHLYEVPINQQIQSSTQIVEGKVISKQSTWDTNRQNIYTINTIEVYKIFKGQQLSTIDIVTEGGVVGTNAQITTSSLELSVGDIGVFMLHDNNVDFSQGLTSTPTKFRPYSAIQGFYKYAIFENKAANPFKTYEGIDAVFYNKIKTIVGKGFANISSFDIQEYIASFTANRVAGGIAITSFSPMTITAGTKSILTINGSGFGTNMGTVSFRDADDGGTSFYTAFDSQIISWSDTEIQVEVPSRAGTGTFRVTSSIGPFTNSTSSLTIPYSEINAITTDNFAYPTQHVDDNGNGGYNWSMNINFFFNTAANQSFTRAFNSWRCETGINWDFSPGFTTTNTIAMDNINIIRFDSGNELPAGVLGRNTSYFNGCSSNGTDFQWYVSELDIVFNDSTNWNYGPSNPTSGQIDFETVAVHELGHGHQLAHVINSTAIMHYATSGGVVNRTLAANDIAGGNDVQSRSTTNPVCGEGLMTNHECSLGVEDKDLNNYISIYPNPAKNKIFINNNSSYAINYIEIFDVTGRSVTKMSFIEDFTTHSINLNNFASGVYVMNIQIEDKAITKKFVVE